MTGFLYDDPKSNSFTNFLPSPETIAQGINSRGDIVGDVFLNPGGAYTNSPQGFYGFLRHKNGTIVFFNVNGSVRTKARGVSESGAITGWFIDAVTGVQRGFVTSLSGQGGFQSLTTAALLDVPGSTATIAEGIDSQGRVCGNWFDASGGEHGFLATPVK